MLQVYIYPKCSTCQKAIKFLNKTNKKYQLKDIALTPPTKKELQQMLKLFKGDLKKLFNTSGIQYRELNLAEKLSSMSLDEALDLLSGNGMLVKRPFVLGDQFGLLGFKEEEWKAVLTTA